METHLAALPFFSTAGRIALYRSEPFEVQTDGLWRRAGSRAVFPRVVRRGEPLAWHTAETAAAFEQGALGLWQPRAECPLISPEEIDLWIVPGVAFTREGARLGRGAGYYDRALAAARPDALTVGTTFECCLMDALDEEPHDVRVNRVVTERGFVR